MQKPYFKTRKKGLLIFVLFPLLFYGINSCSPNEPELPPPKPHGYQEDVPWPSLADSPWPMYRADPQSTGRSKAAGPSIGTASWQLDSIAIGTGFAYDGDSTIYFAAIDQYQPNYKEGGLYAVTPQGNIKWKFSFPVDDLYRGSSSPIIGNDGIIYFSAPNDKKFYALYPDGRIKWELETGTIIMQTGINIGKDGKIYALGFNENSSSFDLHAISKNGEILWTFSDLVVMGEWLNGMTFSPDGKVLYIPGITTGPGITAFDVENKMVLWTFGEKRLVKAGTPLVDYDGNIYVISNDEENNGKLFSLNREGNIRWASKLTDNSYYAQWSSAKGYDLFAMDKMGNIFVGNMSLSCINYSGELVWEKELESPISSPIVIDKNNIAYFTISSENSAKFLAYDNNGNQLLSEEFNGTSYWESSPALVSDNILISFHHLNKIYSIK